MTDGVDEACYLMKAPKVQPIPEKVFNALPSDFLPDDFEAQIIDCILHGELYVRIGLNFLVDIQIFRILHTKNCQGGMILFSSG